MSTNPVYTLVTPVISEKTLALARELNGYTFIVKPRVNKNQVAEAIETQFDVHVIGVRLSKKGVKTIRTGKKRQKRVVLPQKKAIVFLKKGESIKLFEVS